MKDLIDLLTSLTPLDQWQNGGQGRTEHFSQGNQGRSKQWQDETDEPERDDCEYLYHPDDNTCD